MLKEDAELQDYRPELLSRRGEVLAWGAGGLALAAWLVLYFTGNRIIWMLPFLAVFLILAALSISLGNWMDRQTTIRISADGVEFRNGLRHTSLAWHEVQQVRVLPSRWGAKVQVIGERAYFEFRTLGEVSVQGEIKGKIGFASGDEILRQIITESGLSTREQPGNGTYYARQ